MIDQNETSTRTEERSALASQLERAHILGNNGEDDRRAAKALAVYRDALETSSNIVEEARQRLQTAEAAQTAAGPDLLDTEDEDSSEESTPLLGRLRNSLRAALEVQHICTFFAATACYQIKTNEALITPDSAQFMELESQESDFYDQAKRLRREILHDASRKAEAPMKKMRELERHGQLTRLPKIKDLDSLGGIESRRIVEKSDNLFDTIREQGNVIVEWRAKMAKFLLQPLVDEDATGNEITGDEYEDSTKQQDELYCYIDAYRAVVADRATCLSGQVNILVNHETVSYTHLTLPTKRIV